MRRSPAARSRARRRLWSHRLRGLSTLHRSELVLCGVRLALGPPLSLRMRGALAAGSYEHTELAVLEATLAADDRVLELGAGLGLLSTWCALRVGSERVHTVEANPALERLIRRNFELNDVAPGLEIGMLTGEAGTREFFVPTDFFSGSAIDPAQWRGPLPHQARSARPVEVPTRPLKERMQTLRPSYLIVDIEGGELELSGFWDLSAVRKLLIELHPSTIGDAGVERVVDSITAQGLEWRRDLSVRQVRYFTRP